MCEVIERDGKWEVSCGGKTRIVTTDITVPNCILKYSHIDDDICHKTYNDLHVAFIKESGDATFKEKMEARYCFKCICRDSVVK